MAPIRLTTPARSLRMPQLGRHISISLLGYHAQLQQQQHGRGIPLQQRASATCLANHWSSSTRLLTADRDVGQRTIPASIQPTLHRCCSYSPTSNWRQVDISSRRRRLTTSSWRLFDVCVLSGVCYPIVCIFTRLSGDYGDYWRWGLTSHQPWQNSCLM